VGYRDTHWTVRVVTWEAAEQGLTAPTDAYPVLRSRGKEGGYGWTEDRLMFPDRLTAEEAKAAVAELMEERGSRGCCSCGPTRPAPPG
jgi:hypothetical protein